MNLEALLALLLQAAICAALAWIAGLLLRARHSILGYVGAGLLGSGIGGWLAAAVHAGAWPGAVTIAGASVHLLWTFVGAALVLLVAKFLPRVKR